MTLDKMPVEETTYGENGMLPKIYLSKKCFKDEKEEIRLLKINFTKFDFF